MIIMHHSTSFTSNLTHGVLPKLCAGCCAAAVAVAFARPAAADTVLGLNLNYNEAIASEDTDPGAGIDLYFGPRLNLAILTLTTELTGGFHDFGGDYDPSVYRLLAGGRLGLGAIIRPSIFAHLGVGHLRYDDLVGDGRHGRTNVAADLGAALDFTILPLVDLGVEAAYNVVGGDEAFEWLQYGVRVTFVLDGED